MSLKQEILRNTQNDEAIDFEVLLLATLLIEKFRFGSVADCDKQVDKEFDADPPNKEDIVILKENIIKFIFRSPPLLLLQQAITTLGRTGDKDVAVILKPFLHRHLRHLLEVNTVIYSSMVALDECGEAVFSREDFGLAEYDLNIADARKYLRHHYDVALPG